MERQWHYQLSVDGAIINRPKDGQLLQKTRETSYYNHLATALQDLLQLNMYGFDSQFGQAREQNKWNRLYHTATVTSLTGERIVGILNVPIAESDPNPFLQPLYASLHPGLYLFFDMGIARFQRRAGLSLESLQPMDDITARLARYEYGDHQTLLPNPGLADLETAIAKKRDMEALEQYRLSLKGQPQASTYETTNYHYPTFPESMSALLRIDLERLQPGAGGARGEHAIGWAQLDYGSKAIPLASLIREDRSKNPLILPGAYIFTTSAPADIERHAGIDLAGLDLYQSGNLRYLKVASLSQDGKTIQPVQAMQNIRESLMPPGEPPYTMRYHTEPEKGASKAPASTGSERTFLTLYNALLHFLAANKNLLAHPFLDDKPVSSIELTDNRQHKTVGHLFRPKTGAGGSSPGFHLQIDPAYLTRAFGEVDAPLKGLQRAKDIHIILSPFTEEVSLKKNSSAATGRRKPPPPAGGKSI